MMPQQAEKVTLSVLESSLLKSSRKYRLSPTKCNPYKPSLPLTSHRLCEHACSGHLDVSSEALHVSEPMYCQKGFRPLGFQCECHRIKRKQSLNNRRHSRKLTASLPQSIKENRQSRFQDANDQPDLTLLEKQVVKPKDVSKISEEGAKRRHLKSVNLPFLELKIAQQSFVFNPSMFSTLLHKGFGNKKPDNQAKNKSEIKKTLKKSEKSNQYNLSLSKVKNKESKQIPITQQFDKTSKQQDQNIKVENEKRTHSRQSSCASSEDNQGDIIQKQSRRRKRLLQKLAQRQQESSQSIWNRSFEGQIHDRQRRQRNAVILTHETCQLLLDKSSVKPLRDFVRNYYPLILQHVSPQSLANPLELTSLELDIASKFTNMDMSSVSGFIKQASFTLGMALNSLQTRIDSEGLYLLREKWPLQNSELFGNNSNEGFNDNQSNDQGEGKYFNGTGTNLAMKTPGRRQQKRKYTGESDEGGEGLKNRFYRSANFNSTSGHIHSSNDTGLQKSRLGRTSSNTTKQKADNLFGSSRQQEKLAVDLNWILKDLPSDPKEKLKNIMEKLASKELLMKDQKLLSQLLVEFKGIMSEKDYQQLLASIQKAKQMNWISLLIEQIDKGLQGITPCVEDSLTAYEKQLNSTSNQVAKQKGFKLDSDSAHRLSSNSLIEKSSRQGGSKGHSPIVQAGYYSVSVHERCNPVRWSVGINEPTRAVNREFSCKRQVESKKVKRALRYLKRKDKLKFDSLHENFQYLRSSGLMEAS